MPVFSGLAEAESADRRQSGIKPPLTAISALRRSLRRILRSDGQDIMADAKPQGSSRRFILYILAAVPIAAIFLAVATAIGSAPDPKVAFDVRIKVSGQDIWANGTTYLRSDGFAFDSGRLTFTGTVTGDEVRIDGKISSDNGTATRDFGASGQLANNRLSATLIGDGGRRMGTLKLELINR
jgi:hypothetical protein